MGRLTGLEAALVVDGGGTKTDVAVLSLDGTLLASLSEGSFVPQSVGPALAAKRLQAVAARALESAGGPGLRAAGVYFSGLDFPFEVAAFRSELQACGLAPPCLLVENDTFALLRAGTDEPTAVAVVCGTGMNCVGRAADGREVRFAAIGEISGDWGGGVSLGTSALRHAARAADGRGPATALEPLVLQALNRASMLDVIVDFHVGDLDREAIPALAPLVFAASRAGDAVARSLVSRQASEVVAFASAALTRLGVLGEPCPVVLGGGVIAARHEELLAAIDAGLAEQAPGARPVIVAEAPIVGAALLVLEALGANAEALARARASLAQGFAS